MIVTKDVELSCAGVWDSRTVYPGVTVTADRTVGVYEMEFILSAGGPIYCNGKAYADVCGAFLLAKPGDVRHTVLPFRTLFCHMKIADGSPIKAVFDRAPFCFRLIDGEKYRALMQELVSRHTAGEGGENLRLLSVLYALAAEISEDSERNRPENAASLPPRGAKKLRLAIDYANEHYAEKITLATLAAAAGYSPNHFQRVFSENMGMSPNAFLLRLRLARAEELLLSTSLRISDVAYLSGFSSQSYFAALFRKKHALSPEKYRASLGSSYLL